VSPEVQVIVQPSLVMSHLHMPMVMLQQHTIMPFIMQQHEHMPPWSIMHRFCIMPQAVASSHLQTIFIPPDTFSIVIVQRGTMSMFVGIPVGLPIVVGDMPPMLMPDIPMLVRSTIIVLVMTFTPFGTSAG
jgi:hypothetical protein